MHYLNTENNIIALASGKGVGSVDIVRISGPDLNGVYRLITGLKKIGLHGMIKKQKIYSLKNGELIDTSMIVFFKGPKSFTGQDVIEINCHGGGYISKSIIEDFCSTKYIRSALPGEFLFRAYINKKVDLVQAESINQIISSESLIEKNKSLENIEGKLSNKILNIKRNLTNLLITIEHELDFDESEIMHLSEKQLVTKVKVIRKDIESIGMCYFFSKSIQSGIRVLLLGRPNVGKSSIYNELLGVNRSIVSEQAGTTRDVVESMLEINGHRVVLIDSAGFWESADKIERMGIDKTRSEIKIADIILLIGESEEDMEPFTALIKNKKTIKVFSKIDLKPKIEGCLGVSSVKSLGFESLSTAISTCITKNFLKKSGENEYLINKRQHKIILQCVKQLKFIEKELKGPVCGDVLAELLHGVMGEFNNIVEPTDREDIINNIFSGFCIGK